MLSYNGADVEIKVSTESLKWMEDVQQKTYPLGELKAPAP